MGTRWLRSQRQQLPLSLQSTHTVVLKLDGAPQKIVVAKHYERGAHYDNLLAMLFVVIEDILDGLNTRILIALVVLASGLLVPVKDLN